MLLECCCSNHIWGVMTDTLTINCSPVQMAPELGTHSACLGHIGAYSELSHYIFSISNIFCHHNDITNIFVSGVILFVNVISTLFWKHTPIEEKISTAVLLVWLTSIVMITPLISVLCIYVTILYSENSSIWPVCHTDQPGRNSWQFLFLYSTHVAVFCFFIALTWQFSVSLQHSRDSFLFLYSSHVTLFCFFTPVTTVSLRKSICMFCCLHEISPRGRLCRKKAWLWTHMVQLL